MKGYLTVAAAAAGLFLAAYAPASATPLTSASPAALGLDRLGGEIEAVHYRPRAWRGYHRPYYRSAPVVSFGLAPYGYVSPYYARPYGYGYSAYPYGYGYGYGYGPSLSFGFRLR